MKPVDLFISVKLQTILPLSYRFYPAGINKINKYEK
jgi:hypothetical protein